MSSRNDLISAIPIPGLSNSKWKDIQSKQERNFIVYEIREEIISKVLDKCQKSYMEHKSVDILLDCALEAWRKIISLYFLRNNNRTNLMSWEPDHPSKPCPEDSMAARRIKINQKEDTKSINDTKEEISTTESSDQSNQEELIKESIEKELIISNCLGKCRNRHNRCVCTNFSDVCLYTNNIEQDKLLELDEYEIASLSKINIQPLRLDIIRFDSAE